MRKLMRNISMLIMIAALGTSLYFIYDYNPSRNIGGFKVFYEQTNDSLILGRIQEVHDGDKVIVVQDEQASVGVLKENDEYDVIETGDVSITITEGDMYKELISINKMLIASVAIFIILLSLVNRIKIRQL